MLFGLREVNVIFALKLELRGANLTCAATTHTLPFDDPDKTKRTAKG